MPFFSCHACYFLMVVSLLFSPFLQNMLSNPAFPSEQMSLVLSKDAIPIIIDGLRSSEDREFWEVACGAIKNIALNDDARSEVGKYEDSIKTIISVITSNADVAVRKAALDALKSLAGDGDNCTQIQESTELGSVIAFIKDQADEVGQTGFGLLTEMLKTKEMINEEGIFKLVTHVMKKHVGSSSIQAAGCIILGNLHLQNEVDAKVAIGLVLTLIEKHSGDNDIQMNGLCALLNICTENPGAASLLRDAENWAVLCRSNLSQQS